MTKTTCRAKDPATCVYHGNPRELAAAAAAQGYEAFERFRTQNPTAVQYTKGAADAARDLHAASHPRNPKEFLHVAQLKRHSLRTFASHVEKTVTDKLPRKQENVVAAKISFTPGYDPYEVEADGLYDLAPLPGREDGAIKVTSRGMPGTVNHDLKRTWEYDSVAELIASTDMPVEVKTFAVKGYKPTTEENAYRQGYEDAVKEWKEGQVAKADGIAAANSRKHAQRQAKKGARQTA